MRKRIFQVNQELLHSELINSLSGLSDADLTFFAMFCPVDAHHPLTAETLMGWRDESVIPMLPDLDLQFILALQDYRSNRPVIDINP